MTNESEKKGYEGQTSGIIEISFEESIPIVLPEDISHIAIAQSPDYRIAARYRLKDIGDIEFVIRRLTYGLHNDQSDQESIFRIIKKEVSGIVTISELPMYYTVEPVVTFSDSDSSPDDDFHCKFVQEGVTLLEADNFEKGNEFSGYAVFFPSLVEGQSVDVPVFNLEDLTRVGIEFVKGPILPQE